MVFLGFIYDYNETYNITYIVGLYFLYVSFSLWSNVYFYQLLIDGKSFNNTIINNRRKIIGITNICIFVLFGISIYKDYGILIHNKISHNSSYNLIIGNILSTSIYLSCIVLSLYCLYIINTSIIMYSVTDG